MLGEAACSPLPCDIAYPLPASGLGWLALAQMSLPCQLLSHREILALCHGRLDKLTHLCSCGYRKAASAPHSCGTREGRPVCNLLSLAVPSSVALALGALTVWHAALITRGETSIERHINKKERQRLQKKGKVSTACRVGGLAGAERDVMCMSLACRSSGTPTVTGAGIIGRCSWVWTRQGKAPGKPLLGRWWLSSTWGCWDRGSPWAAGA